LLLIVGSGVGDGVRVVSGGGGCRGRGCLAHGARGSIERLGGGKGGGDLALGVVGSGEFWMVRAEKAGNWLGGSWRPGKADRGRRTRSKRT
jgi:hypothetical protein